MTDTGYDLLRGAITKQAVVDYMNGSGTNDERDSTSGIEKFFKSKWFSELCGLDGGWMIKTLRKEKKERGGKRWRFEEPYPSKQ